MDKNKNKSDSLWDRTNAHNSVRKNGGTPREAIQAYCAGNKWLTENAKAVGNL